MLIFFLQIPLFYPCTSDYQSFSFCVFSKLAATCVFLKYVVAVRFLGTELSVTNSNVTNSNVEIESNWKMPHWQFHLQVFIMKFMILSGILSNFRLSIIQVSGTISLASL